LFTEFQFKIYQAQVESTCATISSNNSGKTFQSFSNLIHCVEQVQVKISHTLKFALSKKYIFNSPFANLKSPD
jgi:hypothetical protein